ncbi:MAG: hypothetical protein JOZ54_25540 [Acidobacteria bacterium]|nr:hypothetical protein [Acidobacteriota bacterium]
MVDASLNGLRVVHQDALPRVGSSCVVTFTWHGRKVTLDCDVKRTALRRPAKSALERALYESGLFITAVHGESGQLLREMIERHVMMALDERRANARGIPPTAAQSFQTGRGDELMRHEYVKGAWRSYPTTDPKQPTNGFTISAAEPVPNIEMLRTTFVDADASGRRMIQQMAEMSISRSEGIPTRRYEP